MRQLNLYGFKKIMANRDNINNVELVNGIGMVDACGQSIHEAQSYRRRVLAYNLLIMITSVKLI